MKLARMMPVFLRLEGENVNKKKIYNYAKKITM